MIDRFSRSFSNFGCHGNHRNVKKICQAEINLTASARLRVKYDLSRKTEPQRRASSAVWISVTSWNFREIPFPGT